MRPRQDIHKILYDHCDQIHGYHGYHDGPCGRQGSAEEWRRDLSLLTLQDIEMIPLPNEVVKEHASPCQAGEKNEDCAD